MSKAELRVEVICRHVPHADSDDEALFVFEYTITIRNVGEVPAQVIARTWHINDANGVHEKVRGLGVVGHQPLIQPGQAFEYSSGTRLRTSTGTMHGRYLCVTVLVRLETGAQLAEIYAILRGIEGLRYLL